MDINIKLNETEYSELISLLYWCVLEQDIRYNDDFESTCNAVRTADGSKLEDNDPLFGHEFSEWDWNGQWTVRIVSTIR